MCKRTHLEVVLESIADGVIAIDERGTVTLFNAAAERLFGYSADEVMGTNVSRLAAMPHRERHDQYIENYLAGGEPRVIGRERVVEGRRKDGTAISLLLKVTESSGSTGRGFVGLVQDLSERNRIERERAARIRELGAVAQLSQLALSRVDLDALLEDCVNLVLRTLKADACGVLELLPGANRLLLRAGHGWRSGLVGEVVGEARPDGIFGHGLRSSVAVVVESFRDEIRFATAGLFADDGAGSAIVVRIEGPLRPFGLLAIHSRAPGGFSEHDVHFLNAVAKALAAAIQRVQAETALRDREGRIRLLLHSTAEAIFAIDRSGMCSFYNPTCGKLLGYEKEDELLGMDMHALVHHSRGDRSPLPEAECSIRRTLETGEACDVSDEVLWRADGSSFPVEYRCHPQRQGGEITGVVVSFLDITDRREAEAALRDSAERLRQARQLEAVGVLAGGVAHDFNNILTIIIGYAETIATQLKEDAEQRADAEEIIRGARQAARLTRQLLAFSRRQVLQPRVIDLNATLSGMRRTLQTAVGENIELEIQLESGLGHVRADPGQIEQVILNLAMNARNAMPDGGRLTIETLNAEVEADPSVCMRVIDNGVGMDEATRSRVFEPFFTAATQGRGSGLGLATVYGIVKQSHGHISVRSELGSGSRFEITLPRVDLPLEPALAIPESPRSLGGSELILVVEDEPALLKLTATILRDRGYTVLEASDGEQALAIQSRLEATVDLLLTDVILQGTDGPTLARTMIERLPEIRVLYVSGYAEDAIVHRGVLKPGVSLLEKPFDSQELCSRVRQVLDADPAGACSGDPH